jgi:preprotein translocase SecF subunit
MSLPKLVQNVDFAGGYRIWFAISAVLLMLGIGAIAVGRLDFGIDFQGGAQFTATSIEGDASEGEVRRALPSGFSDEAVIQSLGSGGYEIQTPPLEGNERTQVREALSQELGAEVSVTSISPTFGNQLRNQALQAVGAALLIIVAYISYRFEFAFAVAAMAALVHDILMTVGFYALVGREVSLVTVVALLTVLGYSLYDTVIIFDRIRENTPEAGYSQRRFDRVINDSIRQVIRRSLYTSLSTIIPIVALLTFGGQTLADFAFALLVGVVSGTYSSIFVASPLLSLYKGWRAGKPRPAE